MSDEKRDPYWWFHGDSVVELYRQLTEFGPDRVRLEARPCDDKLYFRVVPRAAAINGDGGDPPEINDSHRCPPECPE